MPWQITFRRFAALLYGSYPESAGSRLRESKPLVQEGDIQLRALTSRQ